MSDVGSGSLDCAAVQPSSASFTCVSTPWSETSPAAGARCTAFTTSQNGAACRDAAVKAGTGGDTQLAAACTACEACKAAHPDGAPCPACPDACFAMYPMYSTMPMYKQSGGTGGGVETTGGDTAAEFIAAFVDPTTGPLNTDDASQGGYPLQKGWTPDQMVAAVQAGLQRQVACWWPAAQSTSQALQAQAGGEPSATSVSGGPDAPNGLLMPSALRSAYLASLKSCRANAQGVTCASAVNNAVARARAVGGKPGAKLTPVEAYLLCDACSINAGLQTPPQLQTRPTSWGGVSARTWYIILGSVAGLVLVIGVAAVLAQKHRLRKRAQTEEAAPR